MLPHLPTHLPFLLLTPRVAAAISVGAATLIGLAWYIIRRPRPTPEEIERARRNLLTTIGRITDGTITDAPFAPDDPTHTPRLLMYDYRIAGVAYECAQDVTALANHVRDIRTDLPVQVRYDLHNPANSIVVSESWSGLRLTTHHPHEPETPNRPRMTTDQHG
ncbi:MAG TPA: hypothetical protein VIX90_06760 [Edaphobacter sp.]